MCSYVLEATLGQICQYIRYFLRGGKQTGLKLKFGSCWYNNIWSKSLEAGEKHKKVMFKESENF